MINLTLSKLMRSWVCVACVLTSVGVQSQVTKDDLATACLDKAMTTAAMVACMNQEYQRLDEELNRVYADLMSRLNPDQRDALRQAQRAWLVFREAEFRAQDALYDTLDGTMYLPLRVSHRSAIVRDRVNQLRSLFIL